MSLIKCKECGNEVSSKAETCPKCGFRLNAPPKPSAARGCIMGLGKLIGGVVGAGIGLMIIVPALFKGGTGTPSFSSSPPTEISPVRQLEIRCEEASKAQPEVEGMKRSEFYESCVRSGAAVIRAQERINSDGNHTSVVPNTVETTTVPASPNSSPEASTALSAPQPPVEAPSATAPTQVPSEKADANNSPGQ